MHCIGTGSTLGSKITITGADGRQSSKDADVVLGGILAAVTGFVSLIGVSAAMLCLAYAVLILGVTDPRHLRRG